MSPLQFIATLLFPVDELEFEIPDDFLQADTADSDLLQVNDWVTVDTLFYGTQQGRVVAIVDNPYHGHSGLVAYVTPLDETQGWTAYLTLTGEVI